MKRLMDFINKSKLNLNSDGTENGFDYVDLGLPSGTMWATCNVGADKIEDYGLLFQWGRTDGYRYDTKNKFRTEEQNLRDTDNKYIPKTTSGKVYKNGDTLYPEDDAAHVNMGGKWKMPTEDQLDELYENTSKHFYTKNDVDGLIFTSRKNNKQLFIPFGGTWEDYVFYTDAKSCGCIWSSCTDKTNNNAAYSMYCRHRGSNILDDNRSIACSVRGVFIK